MHKLFPAVVFADWLCSGKRLTLNSVIFLLNKTVWTETSSWIIGDYYVIQMLLPICVTFTKEEDKRPNSPSVVPWLTLLTVCDGVDYCLSGFQQCFSFWFHPSKTWSQESWWTNWTHGIQSGVCWDGLCGEKILSLTTIGAELWLQSSDRRLSLASAFENSQFLEDWMVLDGCGTKCKVSATTQ